jgi:hypothetical protein
MSRTSRTALTLALVVPALALTVAPASRAAADPTYLPAERAIASTETFDYVGGEQTFVVPDGIYEIDVEAVGAPGGLSAGGRGAAVTATLSVEPGDVFYVRVGGGGGSGFGGWNGGGNPVAGSNGSAGGGGGATDLRTCGASETGCSPLGSRIVVAGGGGGAGGISGGGENAAGDAGAAAPDYAGVRGPAGGGGAGTASAGGAGGVDASYANGGRGNGNPGTYGTGGSSRYTGTTYRGAGGGGGGLYGGGGGGTNQFYGAGGGGGSSLVPPGGTLALAERTVGSHLSISYDAGPVTEVSVGVADTIVATGADSTTVTATASLEDGKKVPGLEVVFESTDPGQTFGPVTDHGDGTYSSTLSGSTTAGDATVTATAKGSIRVYDVSGSADVTTEGYSLTVEPVTDTLVATGADSLTVTATAESDSGASLSDLPVTFESSDEGQSFGAVTDHGDGTYSATLNGSTTAGTATISASASGDPTTTPGTVETEGYTVTVQPVSAKLVATGLDSVAVTATAKSASGELLPGLDVSFGSSDPGQSFGAVTDAGGGTYSTTLSGSTEVGTATVTATVTGAGEPTLVGTSVETEGYTVTVQPVPTKLVATGLDAVAVTATAKSASGELLPGLDVSFGSSDPGQSFGAVTDAGGGTYSTTLSGSTEVGSATVTAAVSGAGEPTLVGTSVATEGYTVTVSPIDEPILGTGAATLTVTALARSASRVPMPGLTVSFVSTDPGQSFGAATDNGDGTYSAKLTGSTTPGIAEIRAVVTGAGAPTTPPVELVTDRYDKPSITAAISSSSPARSGWFRTPVTVTFACAGTLPLTAACPGPVVLGADGRDQVVTRTVTDSLGSTTSVTSSAVSIDGTSPRVSVTGARNGATYKKPRKLVCKGTDALSGVASCKVTTTKKKSKKRTVVRWQATAVDRAGNTATSKGQYSIKKKVKKKPKRH